VPTEPIQEHRTPINEAVAHFGSLVNRSAAVELAPYSKSLLQLVLRPEVDRTLRGPIVRAALAYATSESEAPFWESLLPSALVPVWAFKALVKINPRHPRIVTALGNLWIRCLSENLNLNVSMLTSEVSKQQNVPSEFLKGVKWHVEKELQAPDQMAAFRAKWSEVPESIPSSAKSLRQVLAVLRKWNFNSIGISS
jgi:hypothetical protein